MIRKLLFAIVVTGGLFAVWTGAVQAQTPTTDTCYGGCPSTTITEPTSVPPRSTVPNEPTTIVEPTSNPPVTTDPSNVVVTTTVSASGSTLPFTGADVAGTALIGIVLLGAGVGLYVTARRKSAAPN